MKAAVHDRYGPPDVVRIEEVETPVPGDRDLLVRVHATTVNRTDCGFRGASPFIVRFFTGLTKPKRRILGSEFSGVVEAVGADVTGFSVGDAVFGRSQDTALGAHAEYLTIPADGAVATKPESLSFAEAGAACDGAMLANMYLRLVDFTEPPRILLNGASGAIGSAGLQLARAQGAGVTAVCKTEAVEIVRGLGADRIIDYRKEDFTALDEAFDVVFDAVGKTSLGRCRHLLKDGGIFFATDLGPWAQNPLLAVKTAVFGGRIRVYFPIPSYRKEEVLWFRELAEAGKYRPVIDRTYPLDEIVAATAYVETGEKIGNVVIAVGGDVEPRAA